MKPIPLHIGAHFTFNRTSSFAYHVGCMTTTLVGVYAARQEWWNWGMGGIRGAEQAGEWQAAVD